MTSRLGRMPLITVAMPVMNNAETIGAAIQSIVDQTYAQWELLVIDDGSTDTTVEVARSFSDERIRIVSDGRHCGLPARLNQAISMANGPLLARMDGDDISYPERFEKQVALLQSSPQVDVVATGILAVRSNGSIVGRQKFRGSSHEEITRTPWSGFHFNHGTWLGYTSWFSKYWYDPTAYRAEDNDILLRSYVDSTFHMIPEMLYAYRVDELSLRKILPARLTLCKALMRQGLRGADTKLLMGLPIQFAKALVDVIAITTGLTYQILRHRAGSVLETEKQVWDGLWSRMPASAG